MHVEFRPPKELDQNLVLPPLEAAGSTPFPGTSAGYTALKTTIKESQTSDELRQSFDHLLNFRSEQPDSLAPINVRSVSPVFIAAARIEGGGQSCAPMIAARFRAAADREQAAGEADPYFQKHLEGAHEVLGPVTHRRHTNAPFELNHSPYEQRRIETYEKNQRLRRHEANLRIIDHLTRQGLIKPEFYAAMLQAPINERYPEALVMLHEQLADPSGAVLDILQANGATTYIRALQNSIGGALQMAAQDDRRNVVLLNSVVAELSDKSRPDAIAFGKTIKVSNIIVDKMKEAGLATPDVTTGRSAEDLRNIGQAVAVILRAGRYRDETWEVKAALDTENELLVGIIDTIAHRFGSKGRTDVTPMTVGDLIMRYPNAEPHEISRMIAEHRRTGTVRYMRGPHRSQRFRLGYGEIS
ncbi:MAG TPA: hypothetical protein VLG11_01795 [Candidatus Saccharimonadales bacterium]|nr:hypothetical protein [Candidatus Saccharimonadales bacterium]